MRPDSCGSRDFPAGLSASSADASMMGSSTFGSSSSPCSSALSPSASSAFDGGMLSEATVTATEDEDPAAEDNKVNVTAAMIDVARGAAAVPVPLVVPAGLQMTSAEQMRKDFYDDGFCIFDIGDHPDIFEALAEHMRDHALRPGTHGNRGEGRTCVNDWRNAEQPQWEAVLHLLLRRSGVKSLLEDVGATRFYDAGGDYIEGRSHDRGEPGERNPCSWHVDCPFYFQWVIASVLVTDVSPAQGPLLIRSWSKQSRVVSVSGRRGLCIVRDASAYHRGSANDTPDARPMPSFRFASAAAVPKGTLLGDVVSHAFCTLS